MSASGHQAHTTSPSALAPFVFRHKGVHRIPPNVRDDGQRPSLGQDGRRTASDLPVGLSEIFLSEGLDTQANQIEAPRQIGVLAHAVSIYLRPSIKRRMIAGFSRQENIRTTTPSYTAQTRLIVTSTLPRVAFEYGQIFSASSIRFFATTRSKPGMLTLRRMLRK